MSIRPLYDRIVVKRVEKNTVSTGGIILSDSSIEKPTEGTVIAVGNGKPFESGEVRPLQVKVGDTILFGKFGGTEVTVEGIAYLVMREEDIMCILD